MGATVASDCFSLSRRQLSRRDNRPRHEGAGRLERDLKPTASAPKRLITDNAGSQMHNRSLRQLLIDRRIKHLRTRPIGADQPSQQVEEQLLGATLSRTMPSKHRRIAVTADAELAHALERVRIATGTGEADATLVRRLALAGAEAQLDARGQRREAAQALLDAMDGGGFDLDLDAIDRLNATTTSAP